jgi:enoyl-CoA hydratase/carnithine racemase
MITGHDGRVPAEIAYDVEDTVATITLNAPDRMNAMRPEMAQDLITAFDTADADDAVRAIVVTGAGRAFCAGADISGGGDVFAAELLPSGEVPPDIAGRVALRIFESTKPVVGAINGVAVGFGATMTLPMDVRLASVNARYSFPFTRRGITPDGCSTWFLPRLVGIDRALEWLVSGRMIELDEVVAAGLVRAVVAADELVATAQQVARTLVADSAPVSVSITRQLLWRMVGAEHPREAHDAESIALFERGASADVREGVAAFLEKRPASFPDRLSNGVRG